MLLKNYSWVYNKSLPNLFCQNIIKHALDKGITKATTGDKNAHNVRNSHVGWNTEPWINNLVMQYIKNANKDSGWNFHIDDNEDIQFTIYGKNQYYDWHIDSWQKPYKKSGKIRKLSASILLNDAFEGGEFEFNLRNHDNENNIFPINHSKNSGTVIVFPSHILHRVNKVTAGTRYSLVCWALGKQFQ
mgnify:CR=1 FL=1